MNTMMNMLRVWRVRLLTFCVVPKFLAINLELLSILVMGGKGIFILKI